ncbi:alginate lyase family protein [Alteromonas sp. RKMC-009]|uniref:alginate lyase family protein n=1 Tax=Alteromonas sp. RKMC-009 TaxID=2267264 RepID=UPI000E6A6344|nr:alginate lyase family protein [Alteromonas sp. RKMC-009]AYA63001.1 hypothetical protein DS731_02690 [Alteromonas sp. RKMC-009]
MVKPQFLHTRSPACLSRLFLLGVLVFLSSLCTAQTFTHPSIGASQLQLTNLKEQQCDERQPAFEQLTTSEYATLTRQHHAYEIVYVEAYTGNKYEAAFRGDAHAARALALMWVATSDTRYLDKAKTILTEWAYTFRDLEVTKGKDDQAYLEAAWALPIWLGAADIIKNYNNGAANWKPANQLQFNKFAKTLGSYASKAYRENNWGATSVLSEIALAVYLEDNDRFAEAVKLYKRNLADVSTASGSLKADYLRDTWHPQYTLISWMQTAEIAWHNGTNLYALSFENKEPRLLKVLEHFAKMFNGEVPSPKGLKRGRYKNSHLKSAGYQIAYNHYFSRQHLDKRDFSYIKAYNDWYPGRFSEHFMSWDALTHLTCTASNRSN